MQLIEGIYYAGRAEERISTTKDKDKNRTRCGEFVRTFELCISDDGLYSVRDIYPGGTDVRDGLER